MTDEERDMLVCVADTLVASLRIIQQHMPLRTHDELNEAINCLRHVQVAFQRSQEKRC